MNLTIEKIASRYGVACKLDTIIIREGHVFTLKYNDGTLYPKMYYSDVWALAFFIDITDDYSALEGVLFSRRDDPPYVVSLEAIVISIEGI